MSTYRPLYAKSHALLIGIDQYRSFPHLSTAVKGVRELAHVLEAEFDFASDDIVVLENEQATRRNIRRRLVDPLSRQAIVGPDDRVIIYFGGHGVTVDTAAGEIGFLVPVDAEPGYEDTLISMDELTKTAAERIHAKHVLFLLDACFSGFATTRMAEGVRRQLNDYLTLPTRQVIAAGTRDQAVSDLWGPGGHSLFTGFLLEGLHGAAPMPGGVLRAFLLAGYLQDAVAAHSKSLQTPQYAQLMGSRGGDFILAVREVDELPEWLHAAAESDESAQRLVAVGSLRDLARADHSPAQARQALQQLSDLAESDPDNLVRSSSQAALREIMPETAMAPLEREELVTIHQPPEEQPDEEETPPPARRRPILIAGGAVLGVAVLVGALLASGVPGRAGAQEEPAIEGEPDPSTEEPAMAPSEELTPQSIEAPPPSNTECDNGYELSLQSPESGETLLANAVVTKSVTLLNTGNCVWEAGTSLQFVEGLQLEAPDSIVLDEAVEPDQETTFEFDLTVPSSVDEPVVESIWQLTSSDGQPIGNPITFSIEVELPVAAPASASGGTGTADGQSAEPGDIITKPLDVFQCTHLGGDTYQWYKGEGRFLILEDGTEGFLDGTATEGPFVGEWQPGCPSSSPQENCTYHYESGSETCG